MIYKVTYVARVPPPTSHELSEIIIASSRQEAIKYGLAVIADDRLMSAEFNSVNVEEV